MLIDIYQDRLPKDITLDTVVYTAVLSGGDEVLQHDKAWETPEECRSKCFWFQQMPDRVSPVSMTFKEFLLNTSMGMNPFYSLGKMEVMARFGISVMQTLLKELSLKTDSSTS
jgi:hypothetical protein